MVTTEIPFDAEEIEDPSTIRAIVEIGRGQRPSGFWSPEFAGGFGVIIWGRGDIIRIWGAGYARTDDPLRGMAVRHILERYRHGTRLLVHSKGLQDQLRNVSQSRGRTKDGKEFDGFEILKPLQEALDRREWQLIPFKARAEPEGHHHARALADIGLKKALVLEPLFSSSAAAYPRNHILATSEDPDPDGIISRLKGAA